MEAASSKGVLVALCTCPDQEIASSLAKGLVEARLAACVNILPGVRSVYRWGNGIQDDEEVLLVIKTTNMAYHGMEAWLVSKHPYDVPEVIALSVAAGSSPYLNWLSENTEQQA